MGTSGYAITTGQMMDVLGNESFIERSMAAANESSKFGSGQGQTEDSRSKVVLDKPDVLQGLKPVNRQSGPVSAESVIEEYNDVVETYFKAITEKK